MKKFLQVLGIFLFIFSLGVTLYASDGVQGKPETPGGLQTPDVNAPPMGNQMQSSAGVVNINTASVDELKMLPGINDQLARNIVDYRDSNGPFKSVDEVLNVSGMSKSEYNRINPYLVLQGDTTYKQNTGY